MQSPRGKPFRMNRWNDPQAPPRRGSRTEKRNRPSRTRQRVHGHVIPQG